MNAGAAWRYRPGPFLGHCRLCWRVTLAIFVAILLIEGIILMPSYRNYERDRLLALAEAGRAATAATLAVGADASETARRLRSTPVRGLVVASEDAGRLFSVGEPLAGRANPTRPLAEARGADGRLEVAYRPDELGLPYRAAARLDSSDIGAALWAFVWRILGLVLLIASFVTVVAMFVLDRLILAPVVGLRDRLRAAGQDPQHPRDFLIDSRRRDELGDVERAFDGLLRRSADTLQALTAREAELREHNASLDQRVRERTWELEAANASLRREIAQRLDAEAQIEVLARFPAENTSPVLRVAGDGRLLYANQASRPLLALWKTREGAALPVEWRELVSAVLANRTSKDAEIGCGGRYYVLQLTPVPAAGYVNVYGIDVTDRKRFEEQLRHQASHDTLTGLPNLSLFRDRIDQSLRRSGCGPAVLLLDLDGFKEINAVAGHQAGDMFLKEAARRLADTVGAGATVARIGGDVFGVLIANCDGPRGAAAVAERLLAALMPTFRVVGREIVLGAGIGIAMHPDDGDGAQELIRRADLALYRAKTEGPSHYRFFTAAMADAAEARQRVVSELRRALRRDEFELHYQPQMALADQRIVGAEALLRWRHPERGLILPDEFIPIAESSGLIGLIGDWVLRAACAQAKRWQIAGLSVRVAVNLSAVQLEQEDLPQRVAAFLSDTGLPGNLLELEITESAAMRAVEEIVPRLSALHALGVKVSVDDFGTGYSSLAYLQQLPIHKMKIDHAFVARVHEDAASASICRAVIQLGQALGLTVIAEGVETAAQLQVLGRFGCDEIQGFLLARPLPPDAVTDLLRRPPSVRRLQVRKM
jgi:diguanylate cyclase (GGDEF)-like protein